jgi:hypothetical protein
VVAAHLHHLGGDVALDQPEDVGVGAALDLGDQPLLGRAQEAEGRGLREAVGQEVLGVVEVAVADHVVVDLPADPLGCLDHLRVLAVVACCGLRHLMSLLDGVGLPKETRLLTPIHAVRVPIRHQGFPFREPAFAGFFLRLY